MSNDGSYGQQPEGQGWNEWTGQPGSQPGWGQPGSQPSAGQYPSSAGSAGYPQPGYPQQPSSGYPQPGYPQQPGYPAGGTTGYTPPQPPPKKKSNLTPLIAGGVGLALIAAITTGVLLSRDDTKVDPTVAPSTSASPTPTIKAPGPGNYDDVVTYLTDEDFTCTDEETDGILSSICTHFGVAPYMIAYVGANASGGLGRVSLEVQEEARATDSKAVSDHLISQFTTSSQASAIKAKIATAAAPGYTKDDKSGDVRYRGNSRGSIVLWMEDWVPSTVEPKVVSLTQAQLDEIVADNGYKCTPTGARVDCTKTVDGVEYLLAYEEAQGQDGLTRLSIRATSGTAGVARPAFQVEAKKVLGELPDGQGTAITDWMAKQDTKAGGMEFVDSKIVDYYPSSTVSGKEAGTIYIWASCWTGVRTQC